MKYLGIDPGYQYTGYCELIDGAIGEHGWIPNDTMLGMLRQGYADDATAVIESPQAQDRPLGKQLRDTIWWAGRFVEAIDNRATPYQECEERDIALWLTGSRSADNSALKQALKDHFGDATQQPCECRTGFVPGARGQKRCPSCKGEKFLKLPGPLHGLNEHELSALGATLCVWRKAEHQRVTPLPTAREVAT